MLMACTPSNNVSFTWSPTQPRAGQSVTFTNTSESGSEWSWSFGDNATGTVKNPTHTYRRPGVYAVTLRVDKRRAWTHTEYIHVYDTVPCITCTDAERDTTGVLDIFTNYCFSASVYNPYSHLMSYRWSLDSSQVETYYPDSLIYSHISGRITYPMDSFRLDLVVCDLDAKTSYHIRRAFVVQDVAAQALFYRLGDGNFFQRRFSNSPIYYEQLRRTTKPFVTQMLDAAQDTSFVGDHRYTCDSISRIVGEPVLGFYIRKARIYYRTSSAFKVCSMRGMNPVTILQQPTYFVTCDINRALLYFAASDGVYTLPLIESDNNRFDPAKLLRINTQGGVQRIVLSSQSYLLNSLQ